jgi:hypothetical protein
VEATKRSAGIEGDARVVVYHRPGEEPENLFWARAPAPPEAQALDVRQLAGPAFLYLWSPGAGLPAAQ